VSLGDLYSSESDGAPDPAIAMKWYRRAADAGDSTGMTRLAMCLAAGDGVERDDKEAVMWARKAAELDNPRGMVVLARMYLDGRGVEKDVKEARAWLKKAADRGNEAAKKLLQEIGTE
jgi:hypothetical protein